MNSKVYVGNLNETTSKSEVENAFAKYGALRNVWLARKPPGFAFVEFEDNRDAEDAVRGLDGTRIGGSRVRVELSHGKARRGGGGGGYQSSRRSYRDSRDSRDYRKEPSRRRDDRRPARSRTRSRSLTNSRSRSRSRSR